MPRMLSGDAPAIPGPRPWVHVNTPAPNIPTVGGLPMGAYASEVLEVARVAVHEGKGQWTLAVLDPRTEWWGCVLHRALEGTSSLYVVGNASGVVESDRIPSWPWEALETVKHVITYHVFSDARERGELGQYWTEPGE